MERKPANIRQVAERAGCSIATVSRVATGNGPVGHDMRRRVIEAALELGFPLGATAAARRPVIGILLPSLTNPVFAGVLAGVEQRARTSGLSVIVGQSNYDPGQEESVVAALMEERPVGLVMTVCNAQTSAALALAAGQHLPAATVYNETVPEAVSAVSIDNRAAMRLLTEELIALGHRSILFVGGLFSSSDRAAHRYRGYCDALRAIGARPLPATEVDFIDATQDVDLTIAFSVHAPTAIVVSNDLLALTVIASLRRMGLRVPQDVSVTGFDGIDLIRHISPKLTTIVQPSRTMGVLAASMVLDMAAGRTGPQHLRADYNFSRGETIGNAPVVPRIADYTEGR